MWFNLLWTGLLGAILGFLTAQGDSNLMLPYLGLGFLIFGMSSLYIHKLFKIPHNIFNFLYNSLAPNSEFIFFGVAYAIIIAVFGWILGTMSHWLANGSYRLNLPPYATSKSVLWFYSFRFICGLIFLFLMAPILIVFPLSFNKEPYFSFTQGMIST